MPYILTQSSIIICPHGGRLQHTPNYAPETVMIDGQLVYFHDDKYFIGGCTVGCQTVEWSNYFRELVFQGSRYFLTNESQASCLGGGSAFKGYALILFHQTKVDTETVIKGMQKKA